MGLVPILLTACDARRDALVYNDAAQCTEARVLTDDECQAAEATAGSVGSFSAPIYPDHAYCVEQFGDRCVVVRGRSSPQRSGFVVALDPDANGWRDARPLYRNRAGQWLTSTGAAIGNSTGPVKVASNVLTSDAGGTTVVRGGFGETAGARSRSGSSFAFGA